MKTVVVLLLIIVLLLGFYVWRAESDRAALRDAVEASLVEERRRLGTDQELAAIGGLATLRNEMFAFQLRSVGVSKPPIALEAADFQRARTKGRLPARIEELQGQDARKAIAAIAGAGYALKYLAQGRDRFELHVVTQVSTQRSFIADESGIIRYAYGRPATRKDSLIQ